MPRGALESTNERRQSVVVLSLTSLGNYDIFLFIFSDQPVETV